MIRFVEFKSAIDGDPIMIVPDKVTCLVSVGNHTIVYMDGDENYVKVIGTIREVETKLTHG